MPNDVVSDLRVLENLVAFRPEGRACSIAPLPELAPFKADVMEFVSAGWTFARPGRMPAEGEARVCVRGSRLMLETGKLTVRFQKGVDGDTAAIAAARCGVELTRKLPMPECWSGRVPTGADLFAAVAKLARHSDVVWAEPDLLEAAGHR